MEVGFGLGGREGITVDDDDDLWGRSSWLPSPDLGSEGPPAPPRRLEVKPELKPRPTPAPAPVPREDRNGVERNEGDDWYWSSW